MTKEFFDALNLERPLGILWKCAECLKSKDDISQVKKDMNTKFSVLDKKLDEINALVSSKLSSIETSSKSYSEVLSKNVKENAMTMKAITKMTDNVSNLKQNIEKQFDQDSEQKYIVEKQLNVCIFNLPNSSAETPEARFTDDINKLKLIFKDKIELKSDDVRTAYRIGKSDNISKPRPVILKLTSPNKRTELLKLKNLSYNNNGSEINIYLAPDRTLKQQVEHKKLVKILKERRSQGEQGIMIKNGKIVSYRPPFPW